MHQALYRKWRPASFDSVVGQEHITSVLAYEVANNKTNHAYLFCGSRGTGKTSCAKILAKAVNCHNPQNGNPCNECESCKMIDRNASMDVLEMDAASNTGVDYIRDIKEEVVFTPSELGTRVYIIDEVHMLTEQAFNALLKTLEEPPPKVIFILATTETQKIPETILSRCQRFDFKRIAISKLVERLSFIAEQEAIKTNREALSLIAKLASGGMRDAISMLELCAGDDKFVDLNKVYSVTGLSRREGVTRVVNAIADCDAGVIFDEISEMYRSSCDISVYVQDIMNYYRDMLVVKRLKITEVNRISSDILDLTESDLAELLVTAEKFKLSTILYHMSLLEDLGARIARGVNKRVSAEMTLVRMSTQEYDDSAQALAKRIDDLEQRLARIEIGGIALPSAPVAVSEKQPVEPVSIQVKEPKESAPAKAVEQKLRDWVEIVSEYEKFDRSTAPFLKGSSAYTDGDLLKINVKDGFSKLMLDNCSAAERILAIARRAHTSLSHAVIEISDLLQEETSGSAIDEL